MKKLGTGLAAVGAGVWLWSAAGMAADQPPTGQSEPAMAAMKGIVLAAGFIRPAMTYEAHISAVTGDNEATGNKRLLGTGDAVYLEFSDPQAASPGDHFMVYRTTKTIYHPVRGQYLGELTNVVGVVKVLKITGKRASATIVHAYNAIYPGDGAMRQTAAAAPASTRQPLSDGTGMIIELPPGRTLIAQNNIVYVDWGRNDGLKPFDRLQVFRETPGTPLQIIGELEVLSVEDLTATARITRSSAPFVRGDRFAAKNTLDKHEGADRPLAPPDRKEALFQEMPPTSSAESLPGGDIPEFGKTK